MALSVSKASNFTMSTTPVMPRTPVSLDMVAMAARIGGLEPSTERLAQLTPAMDGFYSLFDALHRDDLGETPPAFAFQAQWDRR